jgi:UCH-binding domain
LINDPDAPAEPEPAAEPDTSNAMANVLTGLSRQPGPAQPISDDLLNSTLSSFPGGPTAFWDGMAASGIGREDLMQMLSGDPNALRDSLLTVPRDAPAPTAASASSPLFAGAQDPAEASGGGLSSNLQERLAELTAGLPGGAGGSQREYVSLNDVLSRDVLARVLEMPDIGERLRPGLPENWEQQGHNVSDAVQSPQFQQVS